MTWQSLIGKVLPVWATSRPWERDGRVLQGKASFHILTSRLWKRRRLVTSWVTTGFREQILSATVFFPVSLLRMCRINDSICVGIAYRSARTILTTDENWPEKDAAVSWGEAEMRRRCFWATFISTRINGDSYIVGSSVDTMPQNVPLPMSERSFKYMLQEPLVTLAELSAFSDGRTSSSPKREPNAIAEIVRLTAHWCERCLLEKKPQLTRTRSKIRDHLEARGSLTTKDCVAEQFILEDWLFEFSRSLPSSLIYSKENMYAHISETQSMNFPLLHICHHQCRLILHASLVPQFSGREPKAQIPRSTLQASAKIAMDSARSISQIAADLVSLDQDLTRLAPFLGYCMYVTASIHTAFVSARDATLAAEAWKNLVPVLQVLKAMKPYWRHLEKLVSMPCCRLSEDIADESSVDTNPCIIRKASLLTGQHRRPVSRVSRTGRRHETRCGQIGRAFGGVCAPI